MKMKALTVGVAGLSLVAAAAFAHSGATGIVKERMNGMKAMAEAMKSLASTMQGSAPYDAERVASHARTIAAHAGQEMTKRFPEGSIEAPSEALPAIWQSWDEFVGLAQQLEVAADGLERAASNGIGGMRGDGSMDQGGGMMTGGMMGGAGMMGGQPGAVSAEHIGEMPADMAFAVVSQTCSACHARFRADED